MPRSTAGPREAGPREDVLFHSRVFLPLHRSVVLRLLATSTLFLPGVACSALFFSKRGSIGNVDPPQASRSQIVAHSSHSRHVDSTHSRHLLGIDADSSHSRHLLGISKYASPHQQIRFPAPPKQFFPPSSTTNTTRTDCVGAWSSAYSTCENGLQYKLFAVSRWPSLESIPPGKACAEEAGARMNRTCGAPCQGQWSG